MTEIDWNPILLAAITSIGVIATGIISIFLAKINKTGNLTHALVNSQSIIQLRLYADTARQLSIAKPNDKAVRARADAADKMVREREKEQEKIDGKKG